MLEFTVDLLEDAHFVVLSANDGHSAVALAERTARTIDLLLSDIDMPGMSGCELAQTLKTLRPEIQVLLMSGDDDSATWALSRGWAFIQKPFAPEHLMGTINSLLREPDSDAPEF